MGAVSVALLPSDQCQDPGICDITSKDTGVLPEFVLVGDPSETLFFCVRTWHMEILDELENNMGIAAHGGSDHNHSMMCFICVECTAVGNDGWLVADF